MEISKLAKVVATEARKITKKAKNFKINIDDTNITVNDTTDKFTEEEIKQAIEKQNPTIYWSDDRNTHWFFDFPFEKDGKRYWISSQNISNDLKNIDVMIFEGNNTKSSKKQRFSKKAESELSDYVEQIRNKGENVKYEVDKIVKRFKYRLDFTYGQKDAKKYGIEVYQKLDEAQKLINSIYKIIG